MKETIYALGSTLEDDGLDVFSAEPMSQYGATLAVASGELPERQGVVFAP